MSAFAYSSAPASVAVVPSTVFAEKKAATVKDLVSCPVSAKSFPQVAQAAAAANVRA